MKVAIPNWNGHVSPLFDVARQVCVYDVDGGTARHTSTADITPGTQVRALRDLAASVLICAAISTQLESLVWVSGIHVVADICGPVEAVARAFAAGDTTLEAFRSPGEGRRRRFIDRGSGPAPDQRHERRTP